MRWSWLYFRDQKNRYLEQAYYGLGGGGMIMVALFFRGRVDIRFVAFLRPISKRINVAIMWKRNVPQS